MNDRKCEKLKKPELTISMPVYNAGRYIGDGILSILAQQGVDFELIIVDDASTDDTVKVVNAIKDERIKLIHNHARRGIGYCRNLVIDYSRSPFIIHVDSNDIVYPEAFKKMLGKIHSDPNIAQVHCYNYEIESDGNVTREDFANRRRQLRSDKMSGLDQVERLLIHGTAENHLQIYRKSVFSIVGKFREDLKRGEEYEMALRILDNFDIQLLPEFLCCYRKQKSGSGGNEKLQELRSWYCQRKIARQLQKKGKIEYTNSKKYNVNRLSILGLYYTLHIHDLRNLLRRFLFSSRLKFRMFRSIVLNKFYNIFVSLISWWPIGLMNRDVKAAANPEKRIAYYEWRFPTLSETFIRREISELIKSGMSVEIFADFPGEHENLVADSEYFRKHTHFLKPIDKLELNRYKKHFFSKHPLKYLNLYMYIVCHRYGAYKTFQEDGFVFGKAIYLAGLLRDSSIEHIHSPWADRCAFVAMIASRLLNIPFTVQARAHDIHRNLHMYAFREKFENAACVITNTQYNNSHIQSLLKRPLNIRLHTIYEGLDLENFTPAAARKDITNRVRLLSVARLIEEKGLTYLIEACRILKDKGYSFQLDIIGGTERPEYTHYYIALRKLRRDLGLDDSVNFLGEQPFERVMTAYKNSDIFCLPCVVARNGGRDISPNSLLEAMAMKMPVISTNIAAIPEIVDHNVNGLLVSPNDAQALAEAMEKLIHDFPLRKKLGENARKKIDHRFDLRKNIQEFSGRLVSLWANNNISDRKLIT